MAVSCGNTPTTPNTNVKPSNSANAAAKPILYDYQIIKTYPHDATAFTQGLEFHNGVLYEGTGGSYTNPVQPNDAPIYSSLRKVDFTSGKVLQKYDLPKDYFGEGITIFGDRRLSSPFWR